MDPSGRQGGKSERQIVRDYLLFVGGWHVNIFFFKHWGVMFFFLNFGLGEGHKTLNGCFLFILKYHLNL